MLSFNKYFSEKYVIGLVEKIYIDGLGVVPAKVDSGNGAYNVIHGDYIQFNGNDCTFKTIGNKVLTKKIVETITINIGAGETEERPVVTFDIKVGDKEFKNEKFSISNRSTNQQPVLICAGLIKRLDALIDITSKNIAKKNIHQFRQKKTEKD
jgi:hypothetical protein